MKGSRWFVLNLLHLPFFNSALTAVMQRGHSLAVAKKDWMALKGKWLLVRNCTSANTSFCPHVENSSIYWLLEGCLNSSCFVGKGYKLKVGQKEKQVKILVAWSRLVAVETRRVSSEICCTEWTWFVWCLKEGPRTREGETVGCLNIQWYHFPRDPLIFSAEWGWGDIQSQDDLFDTSLGMLLRSRTRV